MKNSKVPSKSWIKFPINAITFPTLLLAPIISMGINPDGLYATPVSNTGIDKLTEKTFNFVPRNVTLSKINGLSGPKRILNLINPSYEGKVEVYFQSLEEEGEPFQEEEGEPFQEDMQPEPKKLKEGNRNTDFCIVEKFLEIFSKSNNPDVPKVIDIITLAKDDPREAARQFRIFMAMEARPDTKKTLSIDTERIDMYLHNRGETVESFFRAVYAKVEVEQGKIVICYLLHWEKK